MQAAKNHGRKEEDKEGIEASQGRNVGSKEASREGRKEATK